MFYLSNAFSLNMVAGNCNLAVKEVSLKEAKELASVIGTTDYTGKLCNGRSVVGHADTAWLLGEELSMGVEFNRESVSLDKGDQVLVGQYIGPRLPEGCSVLPEGSKITWKLVTVS